MKNDIFVQCDFTYFEGPHEVSVHIRGNVEPGADAATDSQGLPTEMATAPHVYTTFITLDNKEATDEEACRRFDLSLKEWTDICTEEMLEALDEQQREYIDDELYF